MESLIRKTADYEREVLAHAENLCMQAYENPLSFARALVELERAVKNLHVHIQRLEEQ